jgi:hypothetical protein
MYRKTPLFLLLGALGCVGTVTGDSSSGSEALMQCLDEMSDYCMLDDLGDQDRRELEDGGCWITGGGHIGDASSFGGAGQNDQDSFGFNAMGMKHGYVRGEIQNTTHLGDVFHGHATWIRCWKDAGIGPEVPKAIPNNAAWGGHGVWNHEEGYTWEAHLADRAEGGSHQDEYEIWITDSAGQIVYSQTATDDLVITGGNFQIHPPNGGHPYEAGEPLPSPVGP